MRPLLPTASATIHLFHFPYTITMASILVSLHNAPRGCEPVDTPGQMLSSFLWPCYPSLSPHFFLVQPYKSTKQQKQLNTGTQDSGTSQSPHLCGLLPPLGSAAMLLGSHCRTPSVAQVILGLFVLSTCQGQPLPPVFLVCPASGSSFHMVTEQ